ncbi:MAG: FtsW/RodA/SpoVE family cell cycle protein [Thermomicrobiales bacterium]|nr:MAG: FtsW/RodA/SpoVE family cell cycle protein [Thermomicrobiales bacterium]
MTVVATDGRTLDGLTGVLRRIRPRPRWLEFRLLALVAFAVVAGSFSLALTVDGRFGLYDVGATVLFLVALAVAHLAQVLAGRRTDQILLPAVAMLGGISLLLMQRLPQDLVHQTILGVPLGLAEVQLVWLLSGLAIATTLGIVVRSDLWLRRYKYTWAAVGVGLLLLTFLFGTELNGQRLTLQIGPIAGQPSELLKVILVVFLAGYLSENRSLLVQQDSWIGPLRMPPLPYLAPMVAMWAIALGIVVVQRDLGAALLFFGVFLAMLYVATGRISLVIIGLILFVLGSALMAVLFQHVRTRVDIWIDPFADPLGAGYQVVQALHAFARGGLLGVGLGAGLPEIGGVIPIPEVHTDFPLAALGEELGMVGVIAILGLYLVVIERGMRIGAAAADDFRSLLAIGLSLVIGVQAFIIAAGNLKVLPLTGVTLPFISYGGSSILVNSLVVGLLLALSDKGVEPPPAPRVGSRWRRLRRSGVA